MRGWAPVDRNTHRASHCRKYRLAGAWKPRNAGNVIGRTQPRTHVDQRLEITCIDLDGLKTFRPKILVASWISRQGNWMKAKALGGLDV